jgi:hypothetical protein
LEHDVYDDCTIPLNIVSGLLAAGSSSVTASSAVSENSCLALSCSGHAEKSDAEEEAAPSPAPLVHGQWKKTGTSCYQGPLWEEH